MQVCPSRATRVLGQATGNDKFFSRHMLYWLCCHPRIRQRKGGVHMIEAVGSILITVVGGIMCHYIIRWLDGDDDDN